MYSATVPNLLRPDNEKGAGDNSNDEGEDSQEFQSEKSGSNKFDKLDKEMLDPSPITPRTNIQGEVESIMTNIQGGDESIMTNIQGGEEVIGDPYFEGLEQNIE